MQNVTNSSKFCYTIAQVFNSFWWYGMQLKSMMLVNIKCHHCFPFPVRETINEFVHFEGKSRFSLLENLDLYLNAIVWQAIMTPTPWFN